MAVTLYCKKYEKNVIIVEEPIPYLYVCKESLSTELPCIHTMCIFHKVTAGILFAHMSMEREHGLEQTTKDSINPLGLVHRDISTYKFYVLGKSGKVRAADYCEEPKSGCFIATAAYGTPYNKEINVLRIFRDNKMLSNDFGTWVVRIYYRCSPPIATIISKSPKMRAIVRFLLRPIILIVKQIK